jgi:beta-glucosidase
MNKVQFPEGFIWGAATSAYQVEGSPLSDGAGPTAWHEFSRQRGRTSDGMTGDVACDHYNRYQEDITSMQELGLKAYRFSVGWGRLFPEPGRCNQKALDFYEGLVDRLLSAGIEPWLTVHHFDEPLWLARNGGFVNRGSIDHLVELGALLFKRLGDRVCNWITINEPTIQSICGYLLGVFPPARKLDYTGFLHCLHHLLLAHSRLCRAWDATGRKGKIGLAHSFLAIRPAHADRVRDVETAAFMDELANGAVLDPLFRGNYPSRVLSHMRRFLPAAFEKDLEEERAPGSYVGINYYTVLRYCWSPLVPVLHAKAVNPKDVPRSAMWEIYPAGIYDALLRLKDVYGNPPTFITENGFPLPEQPGRDPLDDGERIDYLAKHVALVAKAIAAGAECRGYFHWSLMDNFEWAYGLSMRFGLVRTDFGTLERQWKKSAFWFQDLVRRNGIHVPAPLS